jgi:Na+/H+-dicarboxylate symporter/ABC-type amino acid transport substrate-binding protein
MLGLLAGLFFGEGVAFLQDVGKAFILLLQMTVLPYIVLALITGLGRLTYQQVATLALRVGGILVLSWVLAFVVILLMPLTFPVWESASFFSTSLLETPERVNFVTLFIPSNPFFALSNNLVPAVVLFSVAIGVALIGIEAKQGLLDHLTILNRAMTLVTQFVSHLTPIGVFGIVASAAGTMGLEELQRLQVYLLTYVAMSLVLTLWLLPAFVTSLTSLNYRQVIGQTRDILITAFATGSALIVLPLLIERSKILLRQGTSGTEEDTNTVDVILPAFTSFPKIGTLLPMSFVLFAGWFASATVPVSAYPTFVALGLVSFFGSVNSAMPLLMDSLRIPADLFQLYLAITVVTGRFAVLVTTVNNLVLALLGACAVCGLITVRWGKLVQNLVISIVLVMLTIAGLRVYFSYALDNEYRQDEIIAGMQSLRQDGNATVHTSPPSWEAPADSAQSRLQQIQARGTLRVGYLSDNMPFAFFNAADELVGFDIDMAHTLARDLEVKLVLVPAARERMAEQLETGYCDIVMSGVVVTPQRAQAMAFSEPYLDQTVAFVVKDHRREDFNSRAAVRHLQAPRIGVPDVPYYIDKVQRYLPQAKIEKMRSIREFFERRGDDLDALVYSAEAGSAWSLLYPAYTVAIPQPDVLTAPSAYPLPRRDRELADFINLWLELKKRDRTIQSLYDYWILGKNAVPPQPRWSVVRNVLHWVK